MLELFGWLGAISLSLCALPQALYCIKIGHARGLSDISLFMWLVGDWCTLIYVIPTMKIPLIMNYTLNLVFLLIMLKYKYWERK